MTGGRRWPRWCFCWAILFRFGFSGGHVIEAPADCPETRWTSICKGTATCQSLAHAGLTCEGVLDVAGCEVICAQPCCIETTTTTGTHTHTDTSTSITHTSITSVTATLTGTMTHTQTTTQTTSVTQTASSITETSTVFMEVTTGAEGTTESSATTSSTMVSMTPGATTQGPAAIMRLAMRVEVMNVDDYREYFEDPSVREAYVDVMSRVANVSSEMIDVLMSTPRLGSIVVQYMLTIPYIDESPSIPLQSIENKLSTIQMSTFNEMLDEAMDRVAGDGRFQQKVVSVTVVDDIPVNMAMQQSVHITVLVMALAMWWHDL